MSVAIPRVVTPSAASGGGQIPGSLTFEDSGTDATSTALQRTPGSGGNTKTFTISMWVKLRGPGAYDMFASAGSAIANAFLIRHEESDEDIKQTSNASSSATYEYQTTCHIRDNNWYHLVFAYDTTLGSTKDRIRTYINGIEQGYTTNSDDDGPDQDLNVLWNSSVKHEIGRESARTVDPFRGSMAQFYNIDGAQLDASAFGYNDPLTGTWRPKKYVGTTALSGDKTGVVGYGLCGCYLPLDGSAPVGKDQSGQGNDWTPKNFGGSAVVGKATGGLPIHETANGGRIASAGIRTDAYSTSLVVGMPLVSMFIDYSNIINPSCTALSITNSSTTFASEQSNFYGEAAKFDGSNDYFYSGSSSNLDFGSGDFTVEVWTYCNTLSNYDPVVMSGTNDSNNAYDWRLYFGSAGEIWADSDVGGSYASLNGGSEGVSDGLVVGKWQHIALVRDGNSVYTFCDGIKVRTHSYSSTIDSDHSTLYAGAFNMVSGATVYYFDGYMQDLRIYKGAAKYKEDFIPASTQPDVKLNSPSGVSLGGGLVPTKSSSILVDGNGDYLSFADSNDFDLVSSGTGDFTIEMWIYPTANSGNQYIFESNTDGTRLMYNGSSGRLHLNNADDSFLMESSAVSAVWATNGWHHLAFVKSSSTGYIFYDGVQYAFHSGPTLGGNLNFNDLHIGHSSSSGLVGYISNVRILKGTALYTANFKVPTEPLTNIPNTKLLCCNDPNSTTGFTVSPGTITANNDVKIGRMNPFDDYQNAQANLTVYCTLNPIVRGETFATRYTNGNLTYRSDSGSANYGRGIGTIVKNSGKWYFEHICDYQGIGVGWTKAPWRMNSTDNYIGMAGDYAIATGGTGGTPSSMEKKLGTSHSSFGSVPAVGDVISCLVDFDNTTMSFWLNGSTANSWGDITTSLPTGDYVPLIGDGYQGGNVKGTLNFGQFPFRYTPPEGYKPLTANTAEPPTIIRSDKYVGVTTYIGTGNGTININQDFNFQPDLIMFKDTGAAENWAWYDAVRGTSNALRSNTDGQQSQFGDVVCVPQSNGFKITGSNTAGINGSSELIASWCWKAGGNNDTFNYNDIGYGSASAMNSATGVNMDAGDINPSACSISTKTGLSIVQYTAAGDGDRVAHGLDGTPDILITKVTSEDSQNWSVYTTLLDGSYDYMTLNSNNAATNSGQTAFNATTFPNIHGSGKTVINYLWKSVPGFSKIGTYVGNGATFATAGSKGNFVTLDFYPRIIWIKRAVANSSPDGDTSHSAWTVYDTRREQYNGQVPKPLYLNYNVAEGKRGDGSGTSGLADLTVNAQSNGFWLSGPGSEVNSDTGQFLFFAWAEQPQHNLYGGISNGRASSSNIL